MRRSSFRSGTIQFPAPGAVRVKISACGVCRTDLHVVDGELPDISYPIIPGHEVVGRVEALGQGVTTLEIGERVGVPWLGYTCGECVYCRSGHENLCDRPLFTGYTRDGGFATHLVADARYCFPLGEAGDDVAIAPLLCAGLIGWRSLVMAGEGKHLGIYGFGAAGHIIAQVARWQGRSVYAFTRAGDIEAQRLAKSLGVDWVGESEQTPPVPLDAAIIYAPVGALVPLALRAVRKGGRVVCAGIHMSDIPSFPYNILWEERQLLSVANLRAMTESSSSRSLSRLASRPIRRHSRYGRPMRFCRSCDLGRSPAPPCCSHDPLQPIDIAADSGSGLQGRVFDFLENSSFGPAKGGKRIDTHASVVFLGSDRALKIKRAVRLPFLDYSTLEKRKHACEEELKVNAGNAPELYRRVVAITRADDGGLEIGGSGTPVEWAVEMARFDEEQTLDRIAEAQQIGPSLAIAIAETILQSHQKVPRAEWRNLARLHSRHHRPQHRKISFRAWT